MKATGEQFFDHIAECMAKFMEEHNLTVSSHFLLLQVSQRLKKI